MKLDATFQVEDEDELREVVGVLNELGSGPDDVVVIQGRQMEVSSFGPGDRAYTLLKADPNQIRFTSEPSKLTQTDKQESILSETLNDDRATIETVMERSESSSVSYVKNILASATLEKAQEWGDEVDEWGPFEEDDIDIIEKEEVEEVTDGEEESDGDSYGGLIGSAEVDSDDERRYRRYPHDTRPYEVLQVLMEKAPSSQNQIANATALDAEVNVGAELLRLHKAKLVERRKNERFGDTSYVYWVTTLGEELLKSRGDWVENPTNEEYQLVRSDLTKEDVRDENEGGAGEATS